MGDYLTARAAVAARLLTVSIGAPVSANMAAVYETLPDMSAVNKFPCVILTGATIEEVRGASGYREQTYRIGIRLMVRPIEGASMRDQLDGLKAAITAVFDGAVALGGNYHALAPRWTQEEPEADGQGVWDDGEIVVRMTDAVVYT
jgi:hypothetical protein